MRARAAHASGVATPDLALLRRLTDTVSVSGDEGAVRALVADEVRSVADDMHEDPLGNLLVVRRGAGPRRLRVMVAAHMDEVGIMILGADADGRFFFDSVGHLDPAQLPGKVLWIGPDRVPGVIGAPPPHLLESDDQTRPFQIDQLRIDIGETTRASALERVRPGMWASYASPFQRSGDVVMARALDDRIGVASLVALVRRPPRGIELLAAFTAQEETGGRGARVAAQAFDPDCALVLDCTAARDVLPDDHARIHRLNARLGEGPVIYVADGSAVYDPRWIAHLRATAERQGIPHQIRQPAGGGTDAGMIHLAGQGIACGAVSVPARNLHGAVSLSLLSDWRGSLHLVHTALARLTPAMLRR